jgi:hypothetical protein
VAGNPNENVLNEKVLNEEKTQKERLLRKPENKYYLDIFSNYYYIMNFLLNNAFKPKHPALLMSNDELKDIIERHKIEVNKNKNKIIALNRKKDEIQSNSKIYIDADVLIAEIDINIQLIESQNKK